MNSVPSLDVLREQVKAQIAKWRQSPAVWDEAAEDWLNAQSSVHTRAAYEIGLRQFTLWRLDTEGWQDSDTKPTISEARPWTVTESVIRDWGTALLDAGLSASTVSVRLAALASFFAFCMERYYVDEDLLMQRPLVETNPVDGVERPKSKPTPKPVLTPEQVQELLAAPNRHTVSGLRNRTLLIAYLLTGKRNSQIRRLRWGDLYIDDGIVHCCWQDRNGNSEETELPAPVYEAMMQYLEAAGRLNDMGPDDYIFVPLEDVADRLPHVEDSRGPISRQRVAQIINHAARAAGLRPEVVNTYTLRRTATRLFYDASGYDLERTRAVLQHTDARTTSFYLNRPTMETSEVWMTVAEMYGL